jgi:peptide-methionine (S)-S-oxide reductase
MPSRSLAAGARDQRRLRPSAGAAMAASSSAADAAAVDWSALGLTPNAGEDVAVLGGGCFWCIEAAFNKMKGCSSAISGYAGGHVERPTYEEVCRKATGHAEVVAVYYDPAVVPYETILRVFFALHDPTTRDQQGNDVGPQYRSAVYTIGEEQRAAAQRVMAEVAGARVWGDKPLVTELAPLAPGPGRFWPAEPVHQRYFEHSPENPYCLFVVKPKVAKFRSQFSDLLK